VARCRQNEHGDDHYAAGHSERTGPGARSGSRTGTRACTRTRARPGSRTGTGTGTRSAG